MRHLQVHVFGRELLSLRWGDPDPGLGGYDHDHTAAQVECAGPAPVGFVVAHNPSLTAVERDLDDHRSPAGQKS